MTDQLDMPFLKDVAKKKRAPRMMHPVDAIVTYGWRPTTLAMAFVALDAGLHLGVRSLNVSLETRNDRTRLPWFQRLPVTFIDNEYKDYDHEQHLSVVAHIRPKYATTRDYMTREQCRAAGIAYYDLDTILKWAEEIERHAEHAIIIPKAAEALKEIPERHVLGYSVPTTYGGTPLDIETFRGRPIHLLGGSWKDQRSLMDKMGDDIVSIDFNAMFKNALYGTIALRDGTIVNLRKVIWGPGHVNEEPTNSWLVSIALSMGFISAALEDEYLPKSGRSLPRIGTRGKAFVPMYELEDEV